MRRAGAFGIAGGTVAADDLDSGVVSQPAGQGGGLAVGQQVNGPAGLNVDQDGAVNVALEQGEVVDPEHPRRRCHRVGHRADQPQQGRATDLGAEHVGQPSAGAPGQHQRHRLQNHVQSQAPTAVAEGDSCDLLDERRVGTRHSQAAEASDLQLHDRPAPTDRRVRQPAFVPTVDAARSFAACRADHVPRTRPGRDRHTVVADLDVRYLQAVQMREQDLLNNQAAHGR